MPTPDWFAELLHRELAPWIALSTDQVDYLRQHYELLLRWNQRMNLTSIKPGPEMVTRHYCESLFFGIHLPDASGKPVFLDIGSGAGFPGVPMAILKPEWRMVLVESSQRKSVFLREATRGLSNTSVLAQRAKDVSLQGDWVVSRAVDPREVLETIPRIAPKIGLMLGEDDFSDIQSLRQIAWRAPVRLPWGDRRLCVYGECSTWNDGKSHSHSEPKGRSR